MTTIRFGTDGWRAIIADEFTFANVRLVAQSIAKYQTDAGMADRGLVIGYDSRFLSERFAAAAAEVIAGSGIRIWMTGAAAPTPATAFAVKALSAGGAMMITAGHNPAEYNGIKFISEYAGSAAPEISAALEYNLNSQSVRKKMRLLPYADARERGLVQLIDPKPAYLAHLHHLLKYEAVSRGPLRIVVDPMRGAGIGYLEDLLRDGCCSVEIIHGQGGLQPGRSLPGREVRARPAVCPEPDRMAELRQAVLEQKADLGLALDGDAGRFGVIDRDGSYLTPNEVISLLLHYLTEYRNWRGAVARSVATTHMIDRIAADYGLPVVETPVGFKYIGQSLLRHRSILGGEESGGLSIQGHIPDKDGILALALVIEMVSFRNKSLRDYQEEVRQKFGGLVNCRLDLEYSPGQEPDYLERMRLWLPNTLGGKQVVERSTTDGVKQLLEDDSWVLARMSGTEPLLRIYAEAADEDRLQQLQEAAWEDLGI